MIATAVYGVLLAGSFALVSFDFSPVTDKPGDTILVDFTEPPVPEPPRPPVKVANEPRVHDVAAPVEQTAQGAGKDPVTQTPNPKALFKMNKGGADEPDNAGNPRAPQGEDKASGDGPGLNPDGLDQLDSTRGDAALGLGVHRILEVHVGVGHVGIGRTGAAVHLVEQPLALKNLDILTNRHLRHSQLIGHVGDADKSVFVQIVENVLVSFRNT